VRVARAALLAFCAAACGSEPAAAPPASLPPALANTYLAACAPCHARPGIGAPLAGDEADWSERRARGLDALLDSTVVGVGGMPPLGTCGLCSEDDLRQLIAYMALLPPPERR
jgi:cytochrome c5